MAVKFDFGPEDHQQSPHVPARAPRGMGEFIHALHETFPEAHLRGRPTGSKNRQPRKPRTILTPAEVLAPPVSNDDGSEQE